GSRERGVGDSLRNLPGESEPGAREASAEAMQQPAAIDGGIEGCGAGPREWTFSRGKAVRAIERRALVEGGGRQPARVDQSARERLGLGQRQYGVAKHPARRALRRDEVGGARGVDEVLVGGGDALRVVAGEQPPGRQSAPAEG